MSVCSRCYSWRSGSVCESCGGEVLPENMCPKCLIPGFHAGAKFCTQCTGNLLKTYATRAHGPNPYSSSGATPSNSSTRVTESRPVVHQQQQRGPTVNPSEVFKARTDDGLAKYRIDSTQQAQAVDRNSLDFRPPALSQQVQPQQRYNAPDHNALPIPTKKLDARAELQSAAVNPSEVLKARTDDGLNKYRIESADQDRTAERTSLEFRPTRIGSQTTQPVYKATVNPSEVLKARTDDGLSKYRISDNEQVEDRNSIDFRPTVLQAQQSQHQYHPPQQHFQPQQHHQQRGLTVSPADIVKAKSEDGLAKYRIDPNAENPTELEAIRPTVFQSHSAGTISGYGNSAESDLWDVTMFKLPSGIGQPVQLFVNGDCVLSSDGHNGNVTKTLSVRGSSAGRTEFVLKLTSVNFDVKKELFLGNGRHIKFEITPAGIKFVQSQNPFL